MNSNLYTLLWIGCGIAFFGAIVYHILLNGQEKAEKVWSKLTMQLQLRHETIPQLIDLMQAQGIHEKKILTATSLALTKAIEATKKTVSEVGLAEGEVTLAVTSLLALEKKYSLRNKRDYLQLRDNALDLERNIRMAQREYNLQISQIEKRMKKFPFTVCAKPFGFCLPEYFRLFPKEKIKI